MSVMVKADVNSNPPWNAKQAAIRVQTATIRIHAQRSHVTSSQAHASSLQTFAMTMIRAPWITAIRTTVIVFTPQSRVGRVRTSAHASLWMIVISAMSACTRSARANLVKNTAHTNPKPATTTTAVPQILVTQHRAVCSQLSAIALPVTVHKPPIVPMTTVAPWMPACLENASIQQLKTAPQSTAQPIKSVMIPCRARWTVAVLQPASVNTHQSRVRRIRHVAHLMARALKELAALLTPIKIARLNVHPMPIATLAPFATPAVASTAHAKSVFPFIR